MDNYSQICGWETLTSCWKNSSSEWRTSSWFNLCLKSTYKKFFRFVPRGNFRYQLLRKLMNVTYYQMLQITKFSISVVKEIKLICCYQVYKISIRTSKKIPLSATEKIRYQGQQLMEFSKLKCFNRGQNSVKSSKFLKKLITVSSVILLLSSFYAPNFWKPVKSCAQLSKPHIAGW